MANHNPPTNGFKSGNQFGTIQRTAKGARQRISDRFLSALSDDFHEHADTIIRTVRENDAGQYLAVVAKLLPAQVQAHLTVETATPLSNLTDDEQDTLSALLKVVRDHAPGADRASVMGALASFVRQALPMVEEVKPAIGPPPC
jgi:hypothetical protein